MRGGRGGTRAVVVRKHDILHTCKTRGPDHDARECHTLYWTYGKRVSKLPRKIHTKTDFKNTYDYELYITR